MYLCIDTTSLASGVALVGKTLFRETIDPRNASENLLITIDKLIKKANINLSDLQAVFIVKGPGSFTGLRVGIAIANQFSHQLNIPIIGVTTDQWWKYRTDEPDILFLQTMNRSEVYKVKNNHSSIVNVSTLVGAELWMGEVSEDHQSKLPSKYSEITSLRSPEETWKHLIKNTKIPKKETYKLIEPFYGKEPNITKSKKS